MSQHKDRNIWTCSASHALLAKTGGVIQSPSSCLQHKASQVTQGGFHLPRTIFAWASSPRQAFPNKRHCREPRNMWSLQPPFPRTQCRSWHTVRGTHRAEPSVTCGCLEAPKGVLGAGAPRMGTLQGNGGVCPSLRCLSRQAPRQDIGSTSSLHNPELDTGPNKMGRAGRGMRAEMEGARRQVLLSSQSPSTWGSLVRTQSSATRYSLGTELKCGQDTTAPRHRRSALQTDASASASCS